MNTKHAGIAVKVKLSSPHMKFAVFISNILTVEIIPIVIANNQIRKNPNSFSGLTFVTTIEIITPIIQTVNSSNGKYVGNPTKNELLGTNSEIIKARHPTKYETKVAW